MVEFNRSEVCDSSACIEVGYDPTTQLVLIRNTTTGRTMGCSRQEWIAFTEGVMNGQRDLIRPWLQGVSPNPA